MSPKSLSVANAGAMLLAATLLAAGEGAAQREPVKFKAPEDIGYLAHPVGIMDRHTYEAYHFDPRRDAPATISYTVSKTGFVRIRLTRRENKDLVLRTLQDWRESRYGPVYETTWDGRDASGNLVDRAGVFFSFESMDRARAGIHESHQKEICSDPELEIVSSAGSTAVDGRVAVTVALAQDAGRGAVAADSIGRLYVDYSLVAEKRLEGGSREPLVTFETNDVSPGRHMLTVNIDDLNDHVGTASIVIFVEGSSRDSID